MNKKIIDCPECNGKGFKTGIMMFGEKQSYQCPKCFGFKKIQLL